MSLKELSEVTENPETLAAEKVIEIWSEGNIFHAFQRWMTTNKGVKYDRLSEILKQGLLPPSLDNEGRVYSDLRLEVKGLSRPYNSVVFLHRFDPNVSFLYVPHSPKSICIFIDREFPVLTIDQMEEGWPQLSQDEVYSTERIPPEKFIGLAAPKEKIGEINQEFQDELRKFSIPLYDFQGNLFWPNIR
jgi:hypothetical protein